MMFARRFFPARATMLATGLLPFFFLGCQKDGSSGPVATAQAAAAEDGQATEESPNQDVTQGNRPSAAGEQATQPSPPNDPAGPAGDGASTGSDSRPQEAKNEAIAEDDPLKPANPFRHRIDIPDLPPKRDWINTKKPLTKRDLKGKFVLFDFWTYCCINCMHVLPELKRLEREFPNELVVIGVHSAKFDEEKETENIAQAVMRYEIEHPVFNDADHLFWDTLQVSSWPTIYLIDPEGKAVWGRSGEFKAAEVAEVLKLAIPYYRSRNLLDERPFPIELISAKQPETPLRFPGKVLADEAGDRLFIADSNHNRIVVTTLDGKLLDVIGDGTIGRADADFKTASFDHPQGMALLKETLYVADTENHLLRKIDLKAKTVSTIAGIGVQARHPWPGLNEFGGENDLPSRFVGKPQKTAINSPWDLWIHDGDLYIAMAGPHQIWKMPLDEAEIGPYAGNGREDIVDGPLLPQMPYETGFASFAQPSGLTSDGTWLFVADSEGSSIRAVPFDSTQEVKTIVGTSELPFGRLFEFGDEDGPREKAKLQHCLGVTFVDGKIYVADTYNDKIKAVDPETGQTKTITGGAKGANGEDAAFDEPAGITHARGKLFVADTNHHRICTIDLTTHAVAVLEIEGLVPPSPPKVDKKPSFKGAARKKLEPATVKPVDGAAKLKVTLKVPAGWKINPLAPMSYWLDSSKDAGPIDRASFGKKKLDEPAAEFEIAVPVTGEAEDELNVSLNYYYCQDKEDGICKAGAVVFTVPLKFAADGKDAPVALVHEIAE